MADDQTDFVHVAVARYADACGPDVLHPDCPFAVTESGGNRSCEQECRDVLVRLSRPGVAKGPAQRVGVFDARQIWLTETGTIPDADWHTISLMSTLSRDLSHPPRTRAGVYLIRRNIGITNALAFLWRRGYDIERLVREGLAHVLPHSIALWVAQEYIQQQTLAQPRTAQGWVVVLEDQVGTLGKSVSIGELLALVYQSDFIAVVQRWLAHAPIDDIVDWRPREDMSGEAIDSDGTARWLLERFGQTYLADWATESLKLEYRHGRGELLGVPRVDLQQRFVDQGDVARHIADRIVAGSDGTRLNDVKRQALSLLSEERRLEAAALFDAVRILEPHNWEAHNNYAFCVSIDDPAAALEALKQGERLEPTPYPLNRVNQAVALYLLGRDPEALEVAEATHAYRDGLAGHTAHMWVGIADADGPKLEVVDGYEYLCTVGVDIAARFGDDQQRDVWRSRMKSP